MFSAEHVCRKIAEWACIHIHNRLLHLAAIESWSQSSISMTMLKARSLAALDIGIMTNASITFAKMASLNTLDHPTLRRRANLAWRALSWCRRTPDHIEKSITHRLHCAMPMSGNFAIQAKWLLQSSLDLHFLLGAIFSTGAVLMLPAGGVKK